MNENISIRQIEDLSLNAWPSFQIRYRDGWVLRYSAFYTHRTNCAEQIGASVLPLPEKTAFCEEAYRKWRTPCIFKISPAGDPALDAYLAKRGYRIEHRTAVMTLIPGHADPGRPGRLSLTAESRISKEWLNGLFRLKNMTDPVHLRIVPLMYDAIPMDIIAVRLEEEEEVTATGLAICEDDAVGIYAIHVAPHRRRQGIAREIVRTLLRKGFERGARFAYLQAVDDNYPAKLLYRSLGFRETYHYWFRCRDLT